MGAVEREALEIATKDRIPPLHAGMVVRFVKRHHTTTGTKELNLPAILIAAAPGEDWHAVVCTNRPRYANGSSRTRILDAPECSLGSQPSFFWNHRLSMISIYDITDISGCITANLVHQLSRIYLLPRTISRNLMLMARY